jgi:hypothetical protein
MHRLTARRGIALMVLAIAAFLLSAAGAPAANATCIPGSLTLLPKPHFEPPRCSPPPTP